MLNDMLLIGLKKMLQSAILKIQLHGFMSLVANHLMERFMKKKLQKINEKELRIEKLIKRKGNKLYIKRKGYDCSFNNWIDKKDIA